MRQEQAIEHSANVGAIERVVSTGLGGLLVARSIQKQTPARVAGALIGADLIYRGLTGYCHVYSAMHVSTAKLSKAGSEVSSGAPEVHRSITIGKPAKELFAVWNDPSDLARIMAHFAEVTPKEDGVTHWRVRGPLKQTFEWDSRRTEAEPGHKLAWETLPGSTIASRGEVAFRPGPNGTEVTLRLQFEPPLDGLGARLVRAFHRFPRAVAGQALRRFKSLVETGEIPTLEHNPSARGASDRF